MIENKFFKEINGNFGFGCMRLPMLNEEVDIEQTKLMVDEFIEAGFNYFDTAHGYINGLSEKAIKTCLADRYPRDKFLLTNKLTGVYFKTEEDIRPLFNAQLEACGVDYFDFYLMHAQSASNFPHYKNCRAYETAFELKKEGKIKHVGLSFHDKPEVLDEILTTYPEIEAVQIQFNYLDYSDHSVQSKNVMDVCIKHNKPVIVMEPVKGGRLINLPDDAQKILDQLNGGSNASYAIRFAASQEPMFMTLSGMSNIEQMRDNLSSMKDFKALSDEENRAVFKVADILRSKITIGCTSCGYCVTENKCPKNIRIPSLFQFKNTKDIFGTWDPNFYNMYTKEAKASDCIKCGMCEKVCPQHLPIRELLVTVANTFEKE